MSDRRALRPLLLAGAGVVLVSVVVGVVAWALRGTSGSSDGTPSAPGLSAPVRVTPEPGSRRCQGVAIVLPDAIRSRGITGERLVGDPTQAKLARGAGSALLVFEATRRAAWGEWQPAVSYLEDLARAEVNGSGTVPKLTRKVRAAARRLDADLAAGVCG